MIDTIDIAPGMHVSRIAKGGWQLADKHGASFDPAQAIEDMRAFVEAGITLFDCADHYIGVEALIGEFRRRYPGLARDLKISTKVVPDHESLLTLQRDDLVRIVDTSLRRLDVERLDLAQFHWWDYEVPGYVQAMQWLAELQREGKIAHLGTTNFDTPRLREIVDSGVRIETNQLQYSVLDRRPDNGLASFCEEHDIALLCYGVLAGGFLSDNWIDAPDPVAPLANRSLVKYRLIIEEFGGWALFQQLLGVMDEIAEAHDVGLSSVATRYLLEKPAASVAILGARNASHLESTLEVFSFALAVDERRAIDTVLSAARGPAGDCYALERDPGGTHSGIMWKNQNRRGAPVDTSGAYDVPLKQEDAR